ncbi:hypothetical protein HMPREF9015_00848 [Leptotrichia wadei F0279]|uniref:Uncharacterized protein n=2 Tax=Leptotrichia wadei TaxID=157687 RepID=U2Q7C1_LEPWF|nr:hypothetical protein HMPREF9015_00848 [Leptotrichia wadei F0279]
MINMNMKNTFKKMVAILGITGISIVSLAMPPKPKNPKPKPIKKNNKILEKKRTVNFQEKRNNKKTMVKKHGK